MGKAVKTELVICSLPACVKNWEVACNRLSHLEIKGRNSSTFGFVIPSGKSRYVKGREPFKQLKLVESNSNFSSSRFIGTIRDLLKLTFKPVANEKMLKMYFRICNCLTQPFKMMSVSSAYCITGK